MIAKHDCDVAINSDALIQTYLLLAIDLLTSQAFEREVRLYKRERAKARLVSLAENHIK